jgi:hypothetical protein
LIIPPGKKRSVDVALAVFLGAVPLSRLPEWFRSSGRVGHPRFRHLLFERDQHWIVRIALSFWCLVFPVSHRQDHIRIAEQTLVNLEQCTCYYSHG